MGGVVYAAVGAFYAVILLVAWASVIMASAKDTLTFGWELIILLAVPLLCGALGAFVAGSMAVLYNLFARKIGGVLIEVE